LSKITWIIFAVVTVGILASLIIISGDSKLDVSTVDTNAIQIANDQNGNIGDHIFGKVDSKVTLIEYGDFQCPPCGNIHPGIKAITEQYKDQLRFVFRNFPITTSHPNAKAAAGTAEAAGLQGKYWEMHNKIYESQSAWSSLSGTERTDFFAGYAKELGLDMDKYNSDLAGKTNSTSVNEKINFDYALGKKAGVDATPTFYLNGVKLGSDALGDETKLKDAIDAELKK
jgi:protein-disulfide isomerase